MRECSQRQVAFKDHFPTLSTENSRLEVEVISGTGKVIAYGSAIANGSQDPTTFEMEYPPRVLAGEAVSGLEGVAAGAGLTGGITSAMLQDGGVAAADLGVNYAGSASKGGPASDLSCTGCVTRTEIGGAGATAGEVLKWTGSQVDWQADVAGITLPYNGEGSSALATDLFRIENYGAGRAIRAVAGADTALWATSEANFGVDGRSTDGVGVRGKSTYGDGVRKDAWAVAHPMAVEPEKGAVERGFYRHPELYGQPFERGVEWAQSHALSSAGPGVSPESGEE